MLRFEMRTETLRNRYPVDPAGFWRIYLSREFTEALYLQGLRSASLAIEHLSGDPSAGVQRRLVATPQTPMPAAVSKLLGGVQSYTETGSFDPRAQTWTYAVSPAAMGNRVEIHGSLRSHPEGEGACTIAAELRVSARILGVGGLFERFIADQFVADMGRQERFMLDWLARSPA